MPITVYTVVVVAALLIQCASAAPDYRAMFRDFKQEYARNYATPEEERKRFDIFVSNMKAAAELSRANPLATFGVNEFADLSAAEFKSHHNGERYFVNRTAGEVVLFSEDEVHAAASQKIDWREKGAVTPVKNQEQCGSCWAFSTTGSIEGQWFLAGNVLTSLSEQELVSCDTNDNGCNGGFWDDADKWLVKVRSGQIVTESSYPYVSGNGNVPPCSSSLDAMPVGATIIGYRDIAHSENQMAAFVYTSGPLSIAVDATSFQTYNNGILTNCISINVDHGVLIVGFDDTNNPPYWIIKNSWGSTWGEQGYIRVEKGTDQCLLTTAPATSIVGGSGSTFEQKICSDDRCQDCKVDKIPLGKCLPGRNASFVAACTAEGLQIQDYSSINCQGAATTVVEPTNQCSIIFKKHNAAYWVTNECPSAPPTASTTITATTTTLITTTSPAGGVLIQKNCNDVACSIGCYNNTFNLNVCDNFPDGTSATIWCNSTLVLVTLYESSNCVGNGEVNPGPVGACVQSDQGGYFENFCDNITPSTTTPSVPTTITTTSPAGGVLIQKNCNDVACSIGCYNNTFNLNVCDNFPDGTSATIWCNSTLVLATLYESSNCVGNGEVNPGPVGACVQSDQGGYFENYCDSTVPPVDGIRSAVMKM